MKLYTVNGAIDRCNELNGNRIYIEGLLTYEIEDISLSHWPKSEQRNNEIWIETGSGAFQLNPKSLEKLSGKKVVCLGQFQSTWSDNVDGMIFGFGHMGLWQAQILATELVYYKEWYAAAGLKF